MQNERKQTPLVERWANDPDPIRVIKPAPEEEVAEKAPVAMYNINNNCPICGETTFMGPGDHCFVCDWENDLYDEDYDEPSAANGLSINQYREKWIQRNDNRRT